MSSSEEFEFVVGEKYENEKGIFTVMSIEKNEMVIRWATGEEAQTTLVFQGRIQQRRNWEKTLQQVKADAVKPPPRKTKTPKTPKSTKQGPSA
jgi:uncharacterized Zn finger protein